MKRTQVLIFIACSLGAWLLVIGLLYLIGWQAVLLAVFLLGALAYARSVYERVKADESTSVDYDEAAYQRRIQNLKNELAQSRRKSASIGAPHNRNGAA